MKDEESQAATKSHNGGGAVAFGGAGKGRRYKLWAIAGILLLAFWSMLTGSVTLKLSTGTLTNLYQDDFDSPVSDDLDILELEEREKLVRHLWDVYTHSSTIKLPKFWLEAFKAAYEDLIGEVPGVRAGAITEIAKLSIKSVSLEFPPARSKGIRGRIETPKQVEENKKIVTVSKTT